MNKSYSQPSRQPVQKKGSGFRPFVAFLLILALFTGFVHPGFIRKSLPALPGGTGGKGGRKETVKKEGIGGRMPGEGKPVVPYETPGNSDPFTISPMEGMTISAEKDALDKNREFKVREATEQELIGAADKLGSHALVVSAFDIDAGLETDEYFPGTYEVELDMETLGIPESLKDRVMVARIDGNGSIFPYSTDCDGKKIRYSSKQNSVGVVYIAFALTIMYGISWTEGVDYRYYNGKRVGTFGNQHFVLQWAAEDFRKHGESMDCVELDAELTQRSMQLFREASDAIPAEIYRVSSNGQAYPTPQADAARRKDVLKAWESLCEKDEEYQDLKTRLYESYPEPIKKIYENADLAWKYLTGPEQNAKMPSYQVPILLKEEVEGTEAKTHKVMYKDISVNISFGNTLYPERAKQEPEGPADLTGIDPGLSPAGGIADGTSVLSHPSEEDLKVYEYVPYDKLGMENMLLTLTHELFHVSQFMYYSSALFSAYTCNLRLFEASANIVEAQAFEYFMKQGLLPESKASGFTREREVKEGHVITLWSQWEYLAVPLDQEPELDSQKNDAGYNEANYLEWMRKNHKDIKMSQMMESFSAAQSFSRTVALAWEMTDAEQRVSYDKFLQSVRDGAVKPSEVNSSDYGVLLNAKEKGGYYVKRPPVKYTDGANLAFTRVNLITPGNTPFTVVAVPDQQSSVTGEYKEDDPAGTGLYELRFAFGEKPENEPVVCDAARNIIYCPERNSSDQGAREIYLTDFLRNPPSGKAAGGGTNLSWGLCVMLPPEKPEIKLVNEEKRKIKLPEMKQDKFLSMKELKAAAKEMGIFLEVLREDGKKFEVRFEPGQAGKTEETDYKPFLEGWKKKEAPEFEFRLMEYFRCGETDYFGPASDPAKLTEDDVFGEYRATSTVLEYGSKLLDGYVDAMGLGLGGEGVPEELKELIGSYQDYYHSANQAIIGSKHTGTMTIRDEGNGKVTARLTFDEKVEGVDTDMYFKGTYEEGSYRMVLQVSTKDLTVGNMDVTFTETGGKMTFTGTCGFDSEIATYKMQLDGVKGDGSR